MGRENEWECLNDQEKELLIQAYDCLLQILGIDDEIDKIKVWARDPQGNPYKVLIRWNKKRLCWEARVVD